VVNEQSAFHELAAVKAGENAFASKIKILGLKALTPYDALFRGPLAHFFAFSPSSTRRRTASERTVSFAAAQASASAMSVLGILMVT
jgi:hypothetical protein